MEETYFGEKGIIANSEDNAILIDMTTSSPKLAAKIYGEAKAVGKHALDAPVSGGDSGAKAGTLSIMVGGVGTVLYEIAGQSKVGIRLNAADVPVAPEVKGVCGMLGLEPLYLACEGRLVIMAPKSEAEKIVEVLRQCPYSKDAAIIGEVTEEQPGHVVMTTEIGTQALLPQPGGELLPRIC